MGKFNDTEAGVLSIFGKPAWLSNSIKTYPSNYETISGTEYIRISVVPSGKGINLNSISGIVIVDIFTSLGTGPKRLNIISDTLDAYLVGKSIETDLGVIQLYNSAMIPKGIDKDNPTLYRALYSIPFNFFVSEV